MNSSRRDEPPDDYEPFVPDPETEWTCDSCGCVLDRFWKDTLCTACGDALEEMKRTKEWKYPYARED